MMSTAENSSSLSFANERFSLVMTGRSRVFLGGNKRRPSVEAANLFHWSRCAPVVFIHQHDHDDYIDDDDDNEGNGGGDDDR